MLTIVHAIGGDLRGGVFNMIYNFNISLKSKCHFIYLVFEKNYDQKIVDKIEKLGGIVVTTPNPRNIFMYILFLSNFYLKNKNIIDVVHVHNSSFGLFDILISRIAGIKKRIIHSHSVEFSKDFLKSIISKKISFIMNFLATTRLACSEQAAISKFGKKNKYLIINNGIHIKDFLFSSSVRLKYRKIFEVENKIVLGHVGAFNEIKNHNFMIDVFFELNKINKNYMMFFVGEGELINSCKIKVKSLGLAEKIIFLGQSSEVNSIMCMFDIFIFPSRSEGLGISLIEAQASGLICLASNNIPRETHITELISYLKIDKKLWVNTILNTSFHTLSQINRPYYNNFLLNSLFSIDNESNRLFDVYNGKF